MRRCQKCNSTFNYKNRLKVITDKDRILECNKCGSKYCQSNFSVKMSFFLPTIFFIVFSNKIALILNIWFYNQVYRIIIQLSLQLFCTFSIMYISQFFSKFEEI